MFTKRISCDFHLAPLDLRGGTPRAALPNHLCTNTFSVHVSGTYAWTHIYHFFSGQALPGCFLLCHMGNPGSCQTCCCLQAYPLVITQTRPPCYCWLQASRIAQLQSLPRCSCLPEIPGQEGLPGGPPAPSCLKERPDHSQTDPDSWGTGLLVKPMKSSPG